MFKPELLKRSLKKCKDIYDLAASHGIKITKVDIGGGLPSTIDVGKIEDFPPVVVPAF